MSLYSYNFTLLARPGRSLLSIGSETTRATIPDFDTVAQLSSFIERLAVWDFVEKSAFTHMKIAIGLLSFIIVAIVLILARKIHQRSFWVVRMVKKPEGSIIMPNAMVVSALLEGMSGVLFIAFMIRSIGVYDMKVYAPLSPFMFVDFIWGIYLFRIVSNSWSTYFAMPNALKLSKREEEEQSRSMKKFLLRPVVLNTGAIIIPLVIVFATGILTILSLVDSLKYSRMVDEWQAKYSSQTDFSQEMVQDAQRIWNQQLKADKGAAIMCLIWATLGFVTMVCYTAISWKLISVIREELYLLETIREEQQVSNNNLLARLSTPASPAGSPDELLLKPEASHTKEERVKSTTTPSKKKSRLFMAAPTPAGEANFTLNQNSYLRGARNHCIVLLILTAPSMFAFSAGTLAIGSTVYGKSEQPSSRGGILFESYCGIFYILNIWAFCASGALIAFAITQRVYEPVFSSYQAAGSEMTASRRLRWKRESSKTNAPTQSAFFDTQSIGTEPSPSLGGLALLPKVGGEGIVGVVQPEIKEEGVEEIGVLEEKDGGEGDLEKNKTQHRADL